MGKVQHTLLHLGDQLLVKQAACLFVERAVDGDDITLGQHLLEILDASTADLLLNLGLERLVVEVQKLFAVERLQTAEHTLTDTANGNGTDNLTLEIVLVLGDSGNIPVTSFDLLVGRDEVADQSEDGHDDVLSDRDDVATSDLSNSDTAIGGVGSVQVDVVRANTGGDGDLQLLGLSKTLGSEVTRVEAGAPASAGVFLEGWPSSYGVVMMTSASTNSLSKVEFSPSLSEVVTRVCP